MLNSWLEIMRSVKMLNYLECGILKINACICFNCMFVKQGSEGINLWGEKQEKNKTE